MIVEGLRIKQLLSNNKNERPVGGVVDTIVVHSMYNPDSANPYSIESCKTLLDREGVSAHFLIDQAGNICQLVPGNERAWHAGVSEMPAPDGRQGVNDFSWGIELLGKEFTDEQYTALINLCGVLNSITPIKHILGHKHVAPNRKTDPENLDWQRIKRGLSRLLGDISHLKVGI